MGKLDYKSLSSAVASIVTQAKLSNDSISATANNLVGLVDKIGLITTLDTVYAIDKLAFFDGQYLDYGKTIEEWSMNLSMPENFDQDGANALAPHRPTFLPVCYSTTIGHKVVPTTVDYAIIQAGVNNANEFINIVSMITKRLQDSMAVYRYQVKREMVGKFIGLCDDAISSSLTAYSAGSDYTVGTQLKNSSDRGIVVKPIDGSETGQNTWANCVANGFIVLYDLESTVAVPEDTETGEAFIKAVKGYVEKAKDLSEGNSLNGNSLGATEGLVLIIKQGIAPTLDVDTLAGAFNEARLDMNVETVVVKDFGAYSGKAYALLMDKRALRLHNTFRNTYENLNGKGAFMNIYAHTEDTAYASRNAFVHVFNDD